MEPSQLDHALLCDCATKDYQVCDLCQIVKPAVSQFRSRIEELESEVKKKDLAIRSEMRLGGIEANGLRTRIEELEREREVFAMCCKLEPEVMRRLLGTIHFDKLTREQTNG